METDPRFPSPSRHHCPDCGGPLADAFCRRCGLALVGEDAWALWRIDQGLHQLAGQRHLVLARLRQRSTAQAAAAATATGTATAGTAGTAGTAATSAPPPPPPPPPPHSPVPGWPPARQRVTVPTLLLGLGTGLIVVAALVFVAVSWGRLGALVQGALLAGLTVAAAYVTHGARRRELTATAEALSLVTLALVAVDAHALREAASGFGLAGGPMDDPLLYGCLALWAVAATAWRLARFSDTRAPLLVAAVAAQLPLPLYVVDRVAGTAALLLCLTQVAAVVTACRPRAGRSTTGGGARSAALTTAGALWLAVVPLAAADGVQGTAGDRLTGAALVGAAAALAALVAGLWAGDARVRPPALGTATGLGLGAIGLALAVGTTGDAWWAASAAACVAVLAVAVAIDPRWGAAPARVALAAGGFVSLPLAVALTSAVGLALEVVADPWRHHLGTPTQGLTGLDVAFGAGPVAAHLIVVALAVVAVRPGRGRWVAPALTLVAIAAVAVAPPALDLPVVAAVALSLVAAYLPMVFLARPGSADPGDAQVRTGVVAATAIAATLALAWGAATPATTVVAVAAAGVLAGWMAALARRDGAATRALGSTLVAVGAVTAQAGLVAAALGSSSGVAWAAAGLAAAGATGAAAVLDPGGSRADLRGRMAATGELAAAMSHVIAVSVVATTAGAGLTGLVLVIGAATAAAHTLRPGRRLMAAGWAVGEVLVLIWQQLGEAGVSTPEAYTVPAAAALALVSWTARRAGMARQAPSWVVHGPWLLAGVAPTVVVALGDPGLIRPLGGLALGAAVLVVGALTRTRAAVDIGAVTVTVLALRQLAPVVPELPHWVTLGTGGLVLLAVGATFEQRRRDLGTLFDRYAQLR